MADLEELRKQRADLDQQIAVEEARQCEAWNDALSDTEAGVRAYAGAASLMVEESQRKNVTSLVLAGGLVAVQLGYDEGVGGRWLSVDTAGDVHATFGMRVAPPPAAVVALVRELLLAQAPPPDPDE